MMARSLRTLRVLRARFREIDLNSRIDLSQKRAWSEYSSVISVPIYLALSETRMERVLERNKRADIPRSHRNAHEACARAQ